MRVLGRYKNLNKEIIRASLIELTVSADDATIAYCAARLLDDRSVIRRAASIIVSSPLLSDEIREEAKQHLPGGKIQHTDILGLGTIKVRGANSRLKRN